MAEALDAFFFFFFFFFTSNTPFLVRFYLSLATGAREGANRFPILMREMTGVIPLSLIPHSVDYI
ncbi:hypothetical protein NC653_039676 [Populus alba x Populus x berolinensis]|uniref:Uncharacterized protein n=1 Tax=Populus alba x Populus x berolinensis TaxID=444605 RepID=A0AAD6LBS4_9ROSI|nr:hypothetical protein NC653_039676 [Populus alba x Populus x berolinensis]